MFESSLDVFQEFRFRGCGKRNICMLAAMVSSEDHWTMDKTDDGAILHSGLNIYQLVPSLGFNNDPPNCSRILIIKVPVLWPRNDIYYRDDAGV